MGTRPLTHIARKLLKDTSGGVMVLTGFAAGFILLGLLALSIDHGRNYAQQSNLDASLRNYSHYLALEYKDFQRRLELEAQGTATTPVSSAHLYERPDPADQGQGVNGPLGETNARSRLGTVALQEIRKDRLLTSATAVVVTQTCSNSQQKVLNFFAKIPQAADYQHGTASTCTSTALDSNGVPSEAGCIVVQSSESIGYSCSLCPPPATWNGTVCQCPAPQIWNTTTHLCEGGNCPVAHSAWDLVTHMCQCTGGSSWQDLAHTICACPPNQSFDANGICRNSATNCAFDEYFDTFSGTCKKYCLNPNYIFDPNLHACICPPATPYDDLNGGCVKCDPSIEILDTGTGLCVPKPPSGGGCSNIISTQPPCCGPNIPGGFHGVISPRRCEQICGPGTHLESWMNINAVPYYRCVCDDFDHSILDMNLAQSTGVYSCVACPPDRYAAIAGVCFPQCVAGQTYDYGSNTCVNACDPYNDPNTGQPIWNGPWDPQIGTCRCANGWHWVLGSNGSTTCQPVCGPKQHIVSQFLYCENDTCPIHMVDDNSSSTTIHCVCDSTNGYISDGAGGCVNCGPGLIWDPNTQLCYDPNLNPNPNPNPNPAPAPTPNCGPPPAYWDGYSCVNN